MKSFGLWLVALRLPNSSCRCGGAGSSGCRRPVGEVAMGLSGSRREVDAEADGSLGGDVVRCCFVAGSATMSSVTFVCCPASCVVCLVCCDD